MVVGAPFERVGIDLTGPHPRSRNGFLYILTYVDHFSKWAEAVPLRNKETTTVADALVDKMFTRVGMPFEILSDQGKEFDSGLMHELCERLGINKVRTSAYKPSTNGATERFHRTLNSMMGRVVNENQRDWCSRLPFIMAAYRSAQHESTGYSPNFIVYGQELVAPIDLVLGRPDDAEYHSMDQFVEQKLEALERAHVLVRNSLSVASTRSKRYYDLAVKNRNFNPGNWVWVYSPRRYVGRSPKWQRNYSGPFLVTRKLSPVLYVVQKSRRAKEHIVHGDKLKPYLGVAPDTWIPGEQPTYEPSGEVDVGENLNSAVDDEHSPSLVTSAPGAPESPSSAPVVLSPFAVEFRPRRQIRLPQRYQ